MDKLKAVAACALFAGSMLTASQSASAASYYVATSGNDSNAGTSASPFLTIQKGVDVAVAGDTIIVGNGTYLYNGGSMGSHVVINKAGNASSWITLQAQNKGQAFLNGNNNLGGHGINFGGSSAYWIIKGFDISNYYWMGIISNSGGGKNIQIVGNTIHNIGNVNGNSSSYGVVGVYTDVAASNWTFDGNVFHDVGRLSVLTGSHDHAIYSHGTNVVITNNVFYNTLNGWHIQTASGFSGTIANNTFYGPDPYPGKVGQIMLWDPNSNLIIRNNIFYNPTSFGITAYASSLSGYCNIDNNIFFSAAGSVGLIDSMPSGCVQSNNRYNVDPQLVNPVLPNYDFHLRSASPAIDAGAAFPIVPFDFDGTPRPQGAGWDIGAFEYMGARPAAPVISAVTASGIGPAGATIGWTTDRAADTLVEYGPTSAYGSATAPDAALTTSHSAALSGLTPSTLYHYRVKSKDAAGSLATSADATCTTTASAPAGACVKSAGVWTNAALTPQTGVFTAEFDGVPTANMDGVNGLSNAAASDYTALAAAVRFNNAGYIDARNGGGYATAAAIPYVAGMTYHFRLVVNVPARTYSAFVSQGASAENLIGDGYAFRTEQSAVSSLANLGLFASAGTLTVCNAAVGAAPVAAPLVISAVTASAVGPAGATIGWTTDRTANTQVEYGPTSAYGSATAPDAALTTSHSAVLSGLTAGTLYHYRVKSEDAAGSLAASSDFTFTTTPAPAIACLTVAGSWKNAALTPQYGAFSVEFDAVPSTAKMDGLSGVSNSAVADYSSVAAAVRFNNAGYIDARNGGAYAADASIPYIAAGAYHFRLAVNLPAHTYSAYVRVGTGPEQLVGAGYAFRTEQAAVGVLNNLTVYTSIGSLAVCGAVVK